MTPEFVALALGGDVVGAVVFRDGRPTERLSQQSASGHRAASRLARLAGVPAVAHDSSRLRDVLGTETAAFGSLVDTRVLALAVWPEEPDPSLENLARRIGRRVSDDPLERAELTGILFLRLLAVAGAAPPVAQAVLADLLPSPEWIASPPPPRPRPLSPARPADLDEAFASLIASGSLERREGQLAYARAVAGAFGDGEVRLLEAGPGTGKTIGYLVPLLLSLAEGEARAVIATRTRALQEQLWRDDLPFVVESLGTDVPRALLKGRENYLCLKRLEEVRRQLLPREVLVPLLAWVAQTGTGDLDELAGLRTDPVGRDVIRQLPDLPYRCGGRACAFWSRCPSRRARERARAARLVVVNHALLGADLASGGMILGPYELLVVDEAHAVGDAVRDALSASLSPPVIPRLLGELRRGGGGHLASWRAAPSVGPAGEAWDRTVVAHRQFWASAAATLARDVSRYREEDLGPLVTAGRALEDTLDDLADAVHEVAEELAEDEDAAQARGLEGEIRRVTGVVGHLLRPGTADTVFWYSREPRGLTLTASPVDIGDHLGASLWPNLVGGVLTSATLSVGDNGASLVRALGIEPLPRFRAWPSPFPYDRVGAFALRYLPHPDDPAYPVELASTLRRVVAEVPRRALALFTSRRLLEATSAHLAGVPHLVQRRDGERAGLLARFRGHPPPVILLGLDTLWEGIDLPGEELELLVVARLPFPVPTDPLIEAQSERIAAGGGSAFRELHLPRAVLRLRQGLGRLVRTPTDRGALIVADTRLATQAYGETFLQTFPVPTRWVDDPERLGVALRDLFR